MNLDLGLDFYLAALSIFLLAGFSCVALLCGVSRFDKPGILIGITYTALGSTLAAVLYNVCVKTEGHFLFGSYTFESLSAYGQILILVLATLCSTLFATTHEREAFFRGEVISIFLITLLGMLVMVSANELISLFVGLEIASIGLYALIGYIHPSRSSQEGAVKYLILGSFASAFMLFGFALLYAATGSMVIDDILKGLQTAGTHHTWIELGGMFTMIGLGFKLALAPFHMWAPDAYESAPTGLTAFMATAVKVMVVVVMLRFLGNGMQHMTGIWGIFFMFTAIASAIIGNIMALVQSSLKRMLAYSSVSHAGYMAIALCALGMEAKQLAAAAVLFYVVVYSLATIAAFAIIMWLESSQKNNIQVDDLSGLASRHPWAAFALTMCMFTFAGIPPTSGFMGKLFLFNAALMDGLYGLVMVGIIGAIIAVYYYLKVIVRMYMQPAGTTSIASWHPRRSMAITAIVSISLVLILLLGTVLPNRAMYVMKLASRPIFESIAH